MKPRSRTSRCVTGHDQPRGGIVPLVMLTTTLLALILAVPPASVEPAVREVSVYDGHVTFEIPSDWVSIPSEVLESHSLQMAEVSGGRLTEIYQYGFRSGDPGVDFVLPECLIQIRESGRLSYRRFLHLPSTEELRRAGKLSIEEKAGATVRGMELSDAVFDRDSYSFHLDNTLVLTYPGKTSVKSVAFLTERGLFTMHFYSRFKETDVMDEISDRIIGSVRFDDDLRYRPRLLDRWPPSPATFLLTAGLLFAVGATVLHLLQRRRKQS